MNMIDYEKLDDFETFGTYGPDAKYPAFPKITRLRRLVIVTEKIDGTNALVHVSNTGVVRAGSRTRWITPEYGKDNFGFAAWVKTHEDQLRGLGPGLHYGEGWGGGIQKRYGAHAPEKKFSLFNTGRWSNPETRPTCCDVVPVLGMDERADMIIESCLHRLRTVGSVVAPGCMNPEGVVVFHTASRTLGKVLLENDHVAKGQVSPGVDKDMAGGDRDFSGEPPMGACG